MATQPRAKLKRRLLRDGVVLGQALTQGGQAALFRATGSGGEQLVVKKLSNMHRVARFEREICVMSSLRAEGCTAVPPLLGSILEDDVAAFWMPYYPDGSLQRRLDQDCVGEPLGLVSKLVGALGELHSFGISHRDIKPDNVLFDGEKVLLADLGLCLETTQSGRLTGTFEQVGARFYMAPEMTDGFNSEHDHHAADLYSMSKVAWCVLRRRPYPFDREHAHWTESNRPSTVMKEPSWRPLEERLMNWMSVRPEDRTVSFAEMLESLELAHHMFRRIGESDRGGPDPEVRKRLQVAAADHRAETERESEVARQSPQVRTQLLIDTAESWYLRTLRPAVTEMTSSSQTWNAFSTYADDATGWMSTSGISNQSPPPSPLLDGSSPPKSVAHTSATSGDLLVEWSMTDYLHGVDVQFSGHSQRRFALCVVLGADELLLEVCVLRNMAGPWMRIPGEPRIVEHHPVGFESTVSRAAELAIQTIQLAVDFIEHASRDPNSID